MFQSTRFVTYKGAPVKIRQVAEELGVRYVLEGSLRRAGGTIRVNAQLIDALSGNHVWAERFDGDAADIFALQDEINDKIVAALSKMLALSSARKPGGGRPRAPRPGTLFVKA